MQQSSRKIEKLPPTNGSLRSTFCHAIEVAFKSLGKIAAMDGPSRDDDAAMIIQYAADLACKGLQGVTSRERESMGCRVWCIFALMDSIHEKSWLKGYIVFSDKGCGLTEHLIEASSACPMETSVNGYPKFKEKRFREILRRLNRMN